VNTNQNMNLQILEFSQLIKHSSRKGRELIIGKIPQRMSTDQSINSQDLKTGQLVKRSSRKGRKLIIGEKAGTVN